MSDVCDVPCHFRQCGALFIPSFYRGDLKVTIKHVPEPHPVSSDYLVAAHYFPGWKHGVHQGWQAIEKFPERTPFLGYYDEENPEVTDWEIKWALEHGINCFVYCWYRDEKNLGQPMSYDGQFLGHALHEGLFHARYGTRMKFAIMWETGNRAAAASEWDLLENLLPYWIDNYFTRSNYLRVDDRPVLFVYCYWSMGKIVGPLGGEVQAARILQRMRDVAAARGLPGLQIGMEYRGQNPVEFKQLQTWGFDFCFTYCWPTPQQHPTGPQAMDHEMHCLEALKAHCPIPYIPTVSVGWDPMPWATPDSPTGEKPDKVTQWKLTPAEWKELLYKARAFMDGHPAGALARRVVMLDNWNEWSEGHYLAPQITDGFGYLDAVREVFTRCDNQPDHRLPGELGLGPYDAGYRGRQKA